MAKVAKKAINRYYLWGRGPGWGGGELDIV